MLIDILGYKLEQLIDCMRHWLAMADFTLRDIAQLVGQLESISRCNRWLHAWFFALQNAIWEAILQRYHVALRISSHTLRRKKYEAELTGELRRRIDSLVSQEIASFIWSNGVKLYPTERTTHCVQLLLGLLTDPTVSLAAPIAFAIPRDPSAVSAGDASLYGGGGHCHALRYWFDVQWSDETICRINLPNEDPEHLQINVLEFAMVIIQFAAFIERLSTLPDPVLKSLLPDNHHLWPILLCLTDSTAAKSCAHRATSKSMRGQQLRGVFSQLLRLHRFGINAEHIAGIKNILADFISRPTHFDLPHSAHCEQIFRKFPWLRTYDYFLPSASTLQLLSLALCTKP
jgi:hypothetical protein